MVMDDCIFCKISRSEIPTHKIYEDDHSFAFLDKHPINPGHTLVIPKFHEANFYQLNENHYSHLMLTVKKLAEQINRVMRPHKVGLIVAGWDIPHAHVHIVPMNDYHDITSKSLLEGKRANPSDAELTKVANSLTSGS